MTPLHLDLLIELNRVQPYGLTVELLLSAVRVGRHRGAALPQIETALRDLADKRLATPMESALVGRWRITAIGTSTLAEEGL